MTARNFAPLMAMAGRSRSSRRPPWSSPGDLDPEVIVTPGIFVQRVVSVPNPAYESVLVAEGVSYP